MKMSLPFLQSFVLNENEATLYELLLKLGRVPAGTIIQEAKLKRPTTYKILYSLEKKGLVTKKDINKKIHFEPVSPTSLFELAEKQLSEIERARDNLKTVLPQLASLYTLSVEKPVIRMYEGAEGLKKAHLEEILSEKKEILAYVRVNPDIDKTLDKFWKKYYHIRIKDKINVRSIVPNTKEGVEYQKSDKDQLRETRLIPLEKYPINIEKNIVGNKVAYFSMHQENFIITIIENKEIADAERAIFELAWLGAEKYNFLNSSI